MGLFIDRRIDSIYIYIHVPGRFGLGRDDGWDEVVNALVGR